MRTSLHVAFSRVWYGIIGPSDGIWMVSCSFLVASRSPGRLLSLPCSIWVVLVILGANLGKTNPPLVPQKRGGQALLMVPYFVLMITMTKQHCIAFLHLITVTHITTQLIIIFAKDVVRHLGLNMCI